MARRSSGSTIVDQIEQFRMAGYSDDAIKAIFTQQGIPFNTVGSLDPFAMARVKPVTAANPVVSTINPAANNTVSYLNTATTPATPAADPLTLTYTTDAGTTAAGAAKKAGGVKRMFAGLNNKLNNIRNKRFFGGPKISTVGTAAMGVTEGVKALKGLYENSKAEQDLDSLKKDINLQIASNPMYDMYMDASDEKTLRQMENGSLTNNWGGALEGGVKGIPQAALSALMGGLISGNPIGAIIGGVGSLINSGIQGYGQDTQEAQAKLQGLYGKLRQANEEYRTMKRPSNLRTSGLQTRYFNQLY